MRWRNGRPVRRTSPGRRGTAPGSPADSDGPAIPKDGPGLALALALAVAVAACGDSTPTRWVLLAHPVDGSAVRRRELPPSLAGSAADGACLRTQLDNVVGDGFRLRSGERLVLACDLPPESVLRFDARVTGLEEGGTCRFPVALDGEPLEPLGVMEATGEGPRLAAALPLPPEGVADARLAFELDTSEGVVGAFLAPVVGPSEVGSYAARPWDEAERRPDLILFVADTFRADNLALHGGDPELAPNLNALAERSLCFSNARSPSVWTLPSHASMFTGLFPLQHGAVVREQTFPPRLETIAERLRQAGYRTGAVTDSAFLSHRFGMDQGFETFVEFDHPHWDLQQTLDHALAFLDRDDGRPVFLFVHTYRTHEPYRVGPDESEEEVRALEARVKKALKGKRQGEIEALLPPFVEEYERLYREGVRALDEGLGPWLAEVERRGLFESGVLLFTSDHGEEFFEHGKRRHGGKPYDEKTRVPLLLHGSEIAPGVVEQGASLADVPPTVAELCGLPVDPGWIGRSLLSLDGERAIFSYNGDIDGSGYLSAVRGTRKVFAHVATQALASGAIDEAYDLGADPGEQQNLAGNAETWPADLARQVAPTWARIGRPGDWVPVELEEGPFQALQALGYVE